MEIEPLGNKLPCIADRRRYEEIEDPRYKPHLGSTRLSSDGPQ
jgi:hypothetical protein